MKVVRVYVMSPVDAPPRLVRTKAFRWHWLAHAYAFSQNVRLADVIAFATISDPVDNVVPFRRAA